MIVNHRKSGSTATNDKSVTLPPTVKAAVKALNIDFAQMINVLSSPPRWWFSTDIEEED